MKIFFVSLLGLGLLSLVQAQPQKPDLAATLKPTQKQKQQLFVLRKPIMKRQYELDQEKRQLVASLSSTKDSKKRDTIDKRLMAIEREYQTLLKKNKRVQDSVLREPKK